MNKTNSYNNIKSIIKSHNSNKKEALSYKEYRFNIRPYYLKNTVAFYRRSFLY